MPRIFGGKEARTAFRKGKPNLAAENTVCYLQVLGLGTDCDDAAPSILLFFDRQRYLFNAGEGFQRFCVEHKIKMNRVSSCLVTRLTGDATGGLPGMCLTMADTGSQGPSSKPQLDIVGPSGISALAAATRTFISSSAVGINAVEFGTGLQAGASDEPKGDEATAHSRAARQQQLPAVDVHRSEEDDVPHPAFVGAGAGLRQSMRKGPTPDGILDPVVENDLVTITPVLLRSTQVAAAAQEPTAHREETDAERPAKRPKVEENGTPQPPPGQPVRAGVPLNRPSPFDPPEDLPAASYVCELSRVPGRFLPDRAAALGVPRGELFATLKSWKAVTLEDGSVVEPHLVNEPWHPGPVAIIADCPDESYLPSLLGAGVWQQRCFQPASAASQGEEAASQKAVDVVCHLARAEIVEREDYQAWMARFGDTTRHIFVNSAATAAAPIMTSSALIQARLNCIHPGIFPMHKFADPLHASASEAGHQVGGPQGSEEGATKSGRLAFGKEGSPVLLTVDEVKKEAVPVAERQRDPGRRRARRRGQPTEDVAPEDHASQSEPATRESAPDIAAEAPPLQAPALPDSSLTADPGLQRDRAVNGTSDLPESGLTAAAEEGSGAAEQEASYYAGRRPRTRAPVKPYKVVERSIAGQNLLRFHLRPPARRGCFDDSEVPAAADFGAVQEEVKGRTELMAAVQNAMESGRAVTTGRGHSALIDQLGPKNLEVVFLGTGAAIPSKYRNVTGIYLNRFARGGMLVDCGEGSYGQLKRSVGDRVDEVIRGLRCIWVSHIHADHHAGLTRGCPDLVVFGPRALHRVLYATSQLQPLAYLFIDCSVTLPRHPGPKEEADKAAKNAALASLGISRLESFTVDHCANAFGLQLEAEDGWKIVFSGDTRPCMNVVQAAKNALILIHEATFEDALESEAIQKKHSMTCEAVEVGHKAKSYRTLLTHFSQRYPKIPVIDPSFQTSTCIAFDLMTVNLVDLPLLPWLVKPLSMLFYGERHLYLEDEASLEQSPAVATASAGPDDLLPAPVPPEELPE